VIVTGSSGERPFFGKGKTKGSPSPRLQKGKGKLKRKRGAASHSLEESGQDVEFDGQEGGYSNWRRKTEKNKEELIHHAVRRERGKKGYQQKKEEREKILIPSTL